MRLLHRDAGSQAFRVEDPAEPAPQFTEEFLPPIKEFHRFVPCLYSDLVRKRLENPLSEEAGAWACSRAIQNVEKAEVPGVVLQIPDEFEILLSRLVYMGVRIGSPGQESADLGA